MSDTKRRYTVGLKNRNDLDDFYTQMDESTGNDTIPSRSCHCVQRRPISRNTEYELTDAEAEELRKDPRVVCVERDLLEMGCSPEYNWTQTSPFNKTTGGFSGSDKNWGLKRVIDGEGVANWGSDGNPRLMGSSVSTTSSGKNVDVVIVDSHINPDHPEFAVNPNGTGGSRVNQINWFQYKDALGYSWHPSTYTYTDSDMSNWTAYDSNHGTHVAGTVAGNTNGWARDANIYNMAYDGNLAGVYNFSTVLWDYLRYFHKNKSINPVTGRRNPTITNHSWGWSRTIYLNEVFKVLYRGTTLDFTWGRGTTSKAYALQILGCNATVGYDNVKGSYNKIPVRSSAGELDIEDCIADGVILIGSAGNGLSSIQTPGHVDYNNRLWYKTSSGGTEIEFDYEQGQTPSSAPGFISVGSVSSKKDEYKSVFSNYGSRVDVWAPGSDIISPIFNKTTAANESGLSPIISDTRDSAYGLASGSGTSMASPQVTGVIACLAEQEQGLTQSEALQYLNETSKTNIGDTGEIQTLTITEHAANAGNEDVSYFHIVHGFWTESNPVNWPATLQNGCILRFEFSQNGKETRIFYFQYRNSLPKYVTYGFGGCNFHRQDGVFTYNIQPTDDVTGQGYKTYTLQYVDYTGRDYYTEGRNYYDHYHATDEITVNIRVESMYANEVALSGLQSTSETWHRLENSTKKYLFYKKKRPESGQSLPKLTQKNRNSTVAGIKYPRTMKSFHAHD